MIEVIRYDSSYRKEWDLLIERSRIDSFLFYRDFMDYHADRFIDNSFLILKKGKIEAVLPGNIVNNTFYSHQGLTYGGIITTTKMTTTDVLLSFNLINTNLRNSGLDNVVYKAIPHIYHKYPAQEDIYALYKLNAQKVSCNISSSVFQCQKIKFSELRSRGVKKALKSNIIISESVDYNDFWEILTQNLLQSHGVKPVHSLPEILLLGNRFPENIKLFAAKKENEIVAGCVMFLMEQVAHVQYISASEDGKISGALDLLFYDLINDKLSKYPVFDFGQSTEKGGDYLNENLIFQKEGFGARGIVYDVYQYSLNNSL